MRSDAILTAVVTLASALLGAGAAGLVVWHSQTRGIRVRERTIAAALLQDLDRIGAALRAASAWDSMQLNHAADYPSFHRWVAPLLAELASRDPVLFRSCMRLEDELRDHRLQLQAWRSAKGHLEMDRNDTERMREFIAQSTNAGTPSGYPSTAIPDAMERLSRGAENTVTAEARFAARDAAVTQLLAELRSRVSAVVAEPLPEFPALRGPDS